MTNEEALDELNVIYERLSHPEDCEQGVYSFRDGDYLEALDVAIKALEQQPCEDAISRADVKKYLSAPDANGDRVIYESDLDLLPSVQSTRRTGRWIDIQYFKNDDTYYRPKCPFCSIEPKEYSNYCPNCGARMEGEK